jgi:hypothetical protein
VRILKLVGWTILVLAIGLAGSVAIIIIANSVVDSQTKVRLPVGAFVYTDAWEQGYVHAVGTFTRIDNERPTSPIRRSVIHCYRDEKSCTSADAQIVFGDMLSVDLSRQKISVWNDTTILFHEDSRCVEHVYTIDRANKRLIGTRTKKPNVSGCELLDDGTISLSLVDGFDVWSRLNQEAWAKVRPFTLASIGAWWIVLLFFGWRLRPRAPA